MTDWTPGGGATSDDGATAPPVPEIVTKRPSLGPAILLVLAVAFVVLLVWVTPRVETARDEWAAATPVLLVVTSAGTDGTAQLTEYGGNRTWTVRQRQLEQVGATQLGSRVQSRLAGDCRCELVLEEPGAIPGYLLLVPLALGAVSVPGIISRRRWRRLRRVLGGPSRPVQLEPVWFRRTFGAPMWGARVATDRAGGTAPGPEGDPVVELAGTPVSWFPVDGSPVEMFGPDPDNGLTVFQSAGGRAVASTAPRSGPAVERGILAWSGALARATGLVPPPATGALDVGGASHQRISVGPTADGGAYGSLTHQPHTVDRSKFFVVLGVNAAWIAPYLIFEPTGAWLLVWLVSVLVAFLLLRRRVAARLATRAPFASWEDRRSAGEAAIAAASLGYTQRADPQR